MSNIKRKIATGSAIAASLSAIFIAGVGGAVGLGWPLWLALTFAGAALCVEGTVIGKMASKTTKILSKFGHYIKDSLCIEALRNAASEPNNRYRNDLDEDQNRTRSKFLREYHAVCRYIDSLKHQAQLDAAQEDSLKHALNRRQKMEKFYIRLVSRKYAAPATRNRVTQKVIDDLEGVMAISTAARQDLLNTIKRREKWSLGVVGGLALATGGMTIVFIHEILEAIALISFLSLSGGAVVGLAIGAAVGLFWMLTSTIVDFIKDGKAKHYWDKFIATENTPAKTWAKRASMLVVFAIMATFTVLTAGGFLKAMQHGAHMVSVLKNIGKAVVTAVSAIKIAFVGMGFLIFNLDHGLEAGEKIPMITKQIRNLLRYRRNGGPLDETQEENILAAQFKVFKEQIYDQMTTGQKITYWIPKVFTFPLRALIFLGHLVGLALIGEGEFGPKGMSTGFGVVGDFLADTDILVDAPEHHHGPNQSHGHSHDHGIDFGKIIVNILFAPLTFFCATIHHFATPRENRRSFWQTLKGFFGIKSHNHHAHDHHGHAHHDHAHAQEPAQVAPTERFGAWHQREIISTIKKEEKRLKAKKMTGETVPAQRAQKKQTCWEKLRETYTNEIDIVYAPGDQGLKSHQDYFNEKLNSPATTLLGDNLHMHKWLNLELKSDTVETNPVTTVINEAHQGAKVAAAAA